MPKRVQAASPGFPWRGKFSKVEELKEYLDHDRLTCLLCGRNYINLGLHISAAHKISMDEYREQFGIPWTYGLAGKTFRARASKNVKDMRKSGKWASAPTKEHLEKLLAAGKTKRAPVAAFRNDSRRKILELHGRSEKWGAQELEEFLRRIASGRTPMEVACDKDMPGRKVFYQYLKNDTKFAKKFRKIWDGLPYEVHVRASKLGRKFQRDVIRLRRLDMTWPEIAATLGVSVHAARTTWHKLKQRGELKSSDVNHEHKRYGRKDYEEYLRRIASGRLITEVGHDEDMPQPDLFYIYLRKNPDFKKKFEKMWESLPYEFQARSKRMGKRFRKDVARLHKQGHDWDAIGKMLGVTPSLARRHFEKTV